MNYKEELLNHLAFSTYNQLIVQKAKEYMATGYVRSIRANNSEPYFHYGIPNGSPISSGHIISIIAYCDLSKYSTKFSETFRKIQLHENVHSVRKRNAEFWWQSKYIKETIEYYGIHGNEESNSVHEKGPFYSGVSCVLPIPEFQIRLYSPTSTSKQIEVSINFATRKGMIITFNNEEMPAKWTQFFDCSWISRYPEENERIFVNGGQPMQVQSLLIIETNKSYKDLFATLFAFDFLVNGMPVELQQLKNMLRKANFDVIDALVFGESELKSWQSKSWTSEQVSTFNQLIDFGYSQSEALDAMAISNMQETNSPLIDPYTKQMFHAYIKQKKAIAIFVAMHDIACSLVSSQVVSMMFQDAKFGARILQEGQTLITERVNLLSPNLFKIFPNIKQITILTSGNYQFNLFWFLDNISTASKWKQITLRDWTENPEKDWNNGGGWMRKLWNNSAMEIQESYGKTNMTIEFERNSEAYPNDLVIFNERIIIKRLNTLK